MKKFKLTWPVAQTAPITQGFGENPAVYARFGLAGHNGVDLGVPLGTVVRAAADGEVLRVERISDQGYGRHVRLQHAGGAVSIYAHLEYPAVEMGQVVQAGEVVGYSGSTGFSTGPHLHFELRLPGEEANGYGGAVDPLALLPVDAVDENPVVSGQQMLASTALNLRLRPGFEDTLRGCLREGDVVTIAGPQRVSQGGFTFVPVLLWVAETYLHLQESENKQFGQYNEDFHIFHDLSTVFPHLSTGFNCFAVSAGCFFLREMPVFPLKTEIFPGLADLCRA